MIQTIFFLFFYNSNRQKDECISNSFFFILAIPQHMRCHITFLCGVNFVESLDGEDDTLIDSSELTTLEGTSLWSFITDELLFVYLTPGMANDLEIYQFDKMTDIIKEFMKKAREDAERMHELQLELVQALTEKKKPSKCATQ